MPHDQRSVERGRKEVLALGALTTAAVAILAIQAWLTSGHFPGWLWPGCLLLVGALSAVASRRHRWARTALSLMNALISVLVIPGALLRSCLLGREGVPTSRDISAPYRDFLETHHVAAHQGILQFSHGRRLNGLEPTAAPKQLSDSAFSAAA